MIRFEVQGGVGVATIDRPERRNALNGELCGRPRDHLIGQPDLRAVVITGSGTAFCAGADLVTRFEDGGPGRSGRRHVPSVVRGGARHDRRLPGARDRGGERPRSARACSSRSRATSGWPDRPRASDTRRQAGRAPQPQEHLAARAARRPGRGARLPPRGPDGRRRRGPAAARRRTDRRRRRSVTPSSSRRRSRRRRR